MDQLVAQSLSFLLVSLSLSPYPLARFKVCAKNLLLVPWHNENCLAPKLASQGGISSWTRGCHPGKWYSKDLCSIRTKVVLKENCIDLLILHHGIVGVIRDMQSGSNGHGSSSLVIMSLRSPRGGENSVWPLPRGELRFPLFVPLGRF